MAWVLAQGEDIVPIPGTKHLNYLQDNCGALAVSLTGEDLIELNRAVCHLPVMGDRYSEEGMKGLNA